MPARNPPERAMSRDGTLAAVDGHGVHGVAADGPGGGGGDRAAAQLGAVHGRGEVTAAGLGRGHDHAGGAAAQPGVVPGPHRGRVAVPQAVRDLDREERLLVLLARGVALPGCSGHDAVAVGVLELVEPAHRTHSATSTTILLLRA